MIIKIDLYAHVLAYNHASEYNIFLIVFHVLKYKIYMILNLQIPLKSAISVKKVLQQLHTRSGAVTYALLFLSTALQFY
jgi:hypothetical protein